MGNNLEQKGLQEAIHKLDPTLKEEAKKDHIVPVDQANKEWKRLSLTMKGLK